jgi:hypothetical protein
MVFLMAHLMWERLNLAEKSALLMAVWSADLMAFRMEHLMRAPLMVDRKEHLMEHLTSVALSALPKVCCSV